VPKPLPTGVDRRVLVTGAGGYTGLALARSLAARGYRVRGIVRKPHQASQLEQVGVEVVTGDVRDRATTEEALAGVPDSEYRLVNVEATRQLVECSAAAGVSRFVHCSTVGVHGDVEGDAPAAEDAPFHPGDMYQLTKLEGERIALRTAERVGLPLTVVRPGPIYGLGDDVSSNCSAGSHESASCCWATGLRTSRWSMWMT
jgi:nucleoside-diphosphate-sugar epimerase